MARRWASRVTWKSRGSRLRMRRRAKTASSTRSAAKAAKALRLARRFAVLRLCCAIASRHTCSSQNFSSGQ
eukprot:5012227-Pleurochrysis_carterae.AAC.1